MGFPHDGQVGFDVRDEARKLVDESRHDVGAIMAIVLRVEEECDEGLVVLNIDLFEQRALASSNGTMDQ